MSADTVPLAHAPAVGSVHGEDDTVTMRVDGTRYRMSSRTARELADALEDAAESESDDDQSDPLEKLGHRLGTFLGFIRAEIRMA